MKTLIVVIKTLGSHIWAGGLWWLGIKALIVVIEMLDSLPGLSAIMHVATDFARHLLSSRDWLFQKVGCQDIPLKPHLSSELATFLSSLRIQIDDASKDLSRSDHFVKTALRPYVNSVKAILGGLKTQEARFYQIEYNIKSIGIRRSVMLVEMTLCSARIRVSRIILSLQTDTMNQMNNSFASQSLAQSVRRFDNSTTVILTASFNRDQYPNLSEVQRLMRATNLSEKQISMWFTNRRCRSKKRRSSASQAGEASDNLTHSPPDSPLDSLLDFSLDSPLNSPPNSPSQNEDTFITTTSTLLLPRSEDNYFAEMSRQADLEFFQTMMGNAGSGWNDFDNTFMGIKAL